MFTCEIINELKEIKKDIEAEKVYQSQLCFLYDHQAEIKKYFPDDPILWEWAGIPEEEYLNQ